MKSFISWLSWTSVVAMFVIQREIPKLYKGFKVIFEDGAKVIPIVDEGAAQNEGEKRKDDDASMK